ncbi:TetR family transcriptional regulator [Actinosynnema sp. ALI-1.44]|uniref:TetR/AcrR family transcriptional regulator n=1 Tax=Actinosynnema sp. ALI-1.44 TaxID=1933779 RepID=UPI00097C7F34|nr:TetR family transcriptional regulator [Actinosynnema sp. ALI-1.44]ONI77275.1 TetR family transcriptional regulator [Actinosynnema sp. ALI-1.44]
MARRSDVTRQAILEAARERFASDGYERTTIRAIAADAGIDPAMVMRYYGNKENLFSVAADLDLRVPDLTEVPRADIGAVLARHVMTRWEGDETLMALLRAGVTNPAIAERMRSIFAAQLGPVVVTVAPGQVETRAGLVSTQVLGFTLCRYILKFPPVVAMSVEDVVRWLGPTLQRYLTEPEVLA